MINEDNFKLNYIKKENQTGSYQGMRFTLQKKDDSLMAIIYPEPYCLEATSDDQKTSAVFELTQEGLHSAIEWLNKQYEERKSYWVKAYENRMNIGS